MKVCHVSPHLPPDQAANAILPAQLGTCQRARGDVVSFVAHRPAQGGTERRPLASVTEIERRGTGLARVLRLDALAMVRAVDRALTAAGPDLVHLHSNGLIIEAAARWARRRRVPYVLTLYGTEIWHYRARWPFDPFTTAYRGAAAVTFYSRLLKARAIELGLDRAGLHVIYPAVGDAFAVRAAEMRAAWRRDLGIDEPLVVLNVKRLHPLAGQRYLIDAFAAVARQRQDVRLVICGTGALRDTLESQVKSLGLTSRVTFAGLVANEDVARYSAVADVFALPSLLEALPTVAVEALASGTPVISADHPGGVELHELFGEDVAVVAKEDVDALATALSAALATPRRATARSLGIIEERFRAPAVLAAYDAVYSILKS